MKEALGSSETLVLTRATRLKIPEDTLLLCRVASQDIFSQVYKSAHHFRLIVIALVITELFTDTAHAQLSAKHVNVPLKIISALLQLHQELAPQLLGVYT
jgi:hypothetical protein